MALTFLRRIFDALLAIEPRGPQAHPVPSPDYGATLAPLVEALKNEFLDIALCELGPRRQIDQHALCRVKSIRARPGDNEAATMLQTGFGNVVPAKVLDFIRRSVLPGNPQAAYFDFGLFSGIELLPAPEGGTDPERQAIREALKEIGLYRWIRIDIERDLYSPPPPTPEPMDITIEDGATSSWSQTISPCERAEAIIVGRNTGANIAVKAALASKTHGSLWTDGGHWWFQDDNSTNGTRLIRQGTTLQLKPLDPVRIGKGDLLVLSAKTPADPNDVARLYIGRGSDEVAPTPVLIDSSPAPEAKPGQSVKPGRRMVLRLKEEGSGFKDHPIVRMPATIGIGAQAQIRLSASFISVSREHLEVVDTDADGVVIRILGSNGLDSNTKKKGETFHVSWDAEMSLGVPEPGEPKCIVSFRRIPST